MDPTSIVGYPERLAKGHEEAAIDLLTVSPDRLPRRRQCSARRTPPVAPRRHSGGPIRLTERRAGRAALPARGVSEPRAVSAPRQLPISSRISTHRGVPVRVDAVRRSPERLPNSAAFVETGGWHRILPSSKSRLRGDARTTTGPVARSSGVDPDSCSARRLLRKGLAVRGRFRGNVGQRRRLRVADGVDRGSQAAFGAVVCRQSFSRLCAAVVRRHSDRAAALPRRWKRSKRRLNLVSAKTGSTMTWRRA